MEKFNDIISKIESMTVVELAELVKTLEEKFGITSAQPMAASIGAGAGAAEGALAGALVETAGALDLVVLLPPPQPTNNVDIKATTNNIEKNLFFILHILLKL